MRRDDEEGDEPEAWQALDADEESIDALSATGTMQAPGINESIVVVEQESAIRDPDATADAPAPDFSPEPTPEPEPELTPDPPPDFADEIELGDTIEDTFSSETAINLDQSDPMAEADFHMAYGLYDQAADLVNGALSVEPERQDLLSKLCEIYFVWGNRDAFTDAAGRLKTAVAGGESAEWDKIVIMGQQIAADDDMFAGAGAPMATKAVDLSFEAETDDTGSLDMELIADSGSSDDVFDIGGADEETDGKPTDFDVTAEMPTMESTLESPTVEEQFDVLSGTAELPSIDETLGNAIETSGLSADATAEIDLDDLGLDLDGLDETEVASLDDLDATAEVSAVEQTGINEELDDLADITGTNLEADSESTGFHPALRGGETGTNEVLADSDATQVATDIVTDVGVDSNLLDATGVTQILSDDFTVDTLSDIADQIADNEATMSAGLDDEGDEADADAVLGDDEKTMMAGLDDEGDEADFDFAKTEALSSDVFDSMSSLDETGELPAVSGTDVDLDLDDLTAALQVSEVGDTIQQMRDDATIEQPRPDISEMGEEDDFSPTMNLEPGEMNEDLHDARTMTEVGTKLDLARAYVDMGDPAGARSILEEVVDEGDDAQRQQAQQLLDSLAT
jgi:pilus assembly protein FimV